MTPRVSTKQLTPALLVLLTTLGCAHIAPKPTLPHLPEIEADARSGVFELLTYNVAGLPGLISSSDPARNTEQVSRLLNEYHVVVAQEDFAYHRELVESTQHLYRVAPQPPLMTAFGNGLSMFSVYPLDWVSPVPWSACHGYLSSSSDCLGEKGFFAVRVQLSRYASVELYNLHAEAGTDSEDMLTRRRGFVQLADYISTRSANRALIVAGDTNLEVEHPFDRATLASFEAKTGLTDICRRLECGERGVDRIFVRPSRDVALWPVGIHTDERFVDDAGGALSDHPAIGAKIGWRVL